MCTDVTAAELVMEEKAGMGQSQAAGQPEAGLFMAQHPPQLIWGAAEVSLNLVLQALAVEQLVL
ncbi:MAG: hypothetical protein A3G38_01645 [Omnitrophica WOR_2 bacterium RIFCSPLOWO2_12_FULL_51_8]|nr:MAG: hypothetical protein A3G38_01645 [Omnitrophica WOR_2 bacterium RIFCSPLOWO2_12_FULL_51_8]